MMAQGHLVKSSGRVICQGQKMYYELLLNHTQYLVKFYDALGKVRLIRPITLPAKSVEIYGVGEYLLCYETVRDGISAGTIYLVKLSDLRSPTQRYKFNLQCDMDEQRKITHVYCSIESSIIIFSDLDRNIYIIRINQKDFTCKLVYQHDRQIESLSLSQHEEVVIVNKEKGVTFVEMEWLQVQYSSSREELLLKSYYNEGQYIIHFVKDRQWQGSSNKKNVQDRNNYFLNVNLKEKHAFQQESNLDKYTFQFGKEDDIIISSGKNYVVVFNKTQNVIVTVYQQLQKITHIDDNIMSHIWADNFLIHFKEDSSHNLLLQVRVFGRLVAQKCCLYQYEIKKEGQDAYQIFFKKNLHIIFQFNGVIAPMYEKQVKEILLGFYNINQQYKNSRQLKTAEEGYKNAFQLGIQTLKVALRHFPGSLHRLLRKLKGNVQFNKSICYIEQTHRLFQYCQHILQQKMDDLIRISESVSSQSKKDSCLKTKDKVQIEAIKTLLQNTINFTHTLINAIRIEVDDQQRQTGVSQFSKKLHRQLQQNYKVYDTARSLFLIARLLQDENIVVKFQQKFKKIRDERQQSMQVVSEGTLFFKLDYKLLFVYQHFQLIILILKQPVLRFTQFIQFLLANRANLVEVAYFYQLVTRLDITPFLSTDVSQFIQNLIYDVPLIRRESQELDEQKKIETKAVLHQMTGMALKVKLYPFIKYMIQLNIVYEQYSLAIMLIFSQSFAIPPNDQKNKEHLFVIKSLIIAKRIDLAHLYVLNHYSPQLFEQFIKLAYINGNTLQILQLNEKEYIVGNERDKLRDLLHIDDKRWSILFGQTK